MIRIIFLFGETTEVFDRDRLNKRYEAVASDRNAFLAVLYFFQDNSVFSQSVRRLIQLETRFI